MMQRLTAYVSGKVQKTGYRARVVTIAQNSRLKGYVQNLVDGRVKVVAEGETIDLETLLRSLDIKNTLIHVVDIKKEYSSASGEFEGFFKVVSGGGETDQRLDVAAERLTELVTVNREILMELKANRQELKETRGDIRDSSDAIVSEIRSSRDAIVGEVSESRDAIVSEIKSSKDAIVGEVSDARDSIVDEIGVLRADLKESVQDRLMRIESDVAQIKAKIGL
jgi:acylphosphatase